MHRRDLLAGGAVLAGTAAAMGTLGAPGGAMAQAPGSQVLTFPVQGLATRGGRGAVSRFEGTVTLTRFVYKGQLGVTGRISGVVQGAGPRTNISNQTFNALATLTQLGGGGGAAAAQVPACTILELDIGAIRLELLGLVIVIAPIAIDITAIPGGGLLGSLLCALADLLNGINLGNLGAVLGLLQRLVTILGQINAILN